MGKLLFLLFTVVPVLELWLLVEVGQWVGAGPTIALVLVTGLIGAALAKHEGLRVIRDWQASMAEGRLPKDGVLSGLLVLVGGVLLVTPGMVTDVLGFSLLVPATRRVIARVIRARLEQLLQQGMAHGNVVMSSSFTAAGFDGGFSRAPGSGGVERPRAGADVIDVVAD